MTNGWNTKKVAAMRRSSGGGAAHWCVGAALLTLAALTFVPPAQAQTSEVLLSNLQQPNFSGGGLTLRWTVPKCSQRAARPPATS